MRRVLTLATTAIACLFCAGVATARTKLVADASVPFVSGNITPKLTLPVGHPIGVRFRDQYMYVTGVEGLTVYDISDPALPKPTGALALPHFENEDVDLGGNTLLITNDPSEGVGILYVVDISNPALPKLAGVMSNGFIEDPGVNLILESVGLPDVSYPLPAGTGHTASCVDKLCQWAYLAGTSRGIEIVDLRNPAAPAVAGEFKPPITGLASHDVQIDGKGLAWIVGADGTAACDVGDPLHPKLVARTDEAIKNSGQLGVPAIPDDPIFHFGQEIGGHGENPIDLIHHDSLRLGTLGKKGTVFTLPNGQRIGTKPFAQKAGQTYPAGGDSPVLGIVEEDYTRPTCEGAGSFQTWGMTDKKTSTGAQKVGLLDMYETELATLVTQRGWAPAVGLCSAHYFDYRDGIVGGGWYEEGARFLDVRDPLNVRQIGYWVPTKGETWSVAFAPTDPTGSIVYAFDFARGIDVLELDRTDLRTRTAPVRRQWLTDSHGVATATPDVSRQGRFGWVCRLPV
jgi:hypothetical protein